MKNILFVFIVIITFSSCKTYRLIYSASPSCNPVFKEKGQSMIAGYYARKNIKDDTNPQKSEGVDLQAAYAFTNHIAATFTYFQRNEKDFFTNKKYPGTSSGIGQNYNRKITEFSVGYFAPINTKKTISINIYAGLGFGKFYFNDFSSDGKFNRYFGNNIVRKFIAPAFNFTPRSYYSIGFALKSSYVNYKNISTTYTTNELNKLSLDRLEKRRFFEPSFFFKVCIPKYPWISLEAISAVATDVTPIEIPEFEVNPTSLSIGLNIDVAKMYKALKK